MVNVFLSDIVIATPGRLADHLRAKNMVLTDSFQMLILDEADLILSFGHDEDISMLSEALWSLLKIYFVIAHTF